MRWSNWRHKRRRRWRKKRMASAQVNVLALSRQSSFVRFLTHKMRDALTRAKRSTVSGVAHHFLCRSCSRSQGSAQHEPVSSIAPQGCAESLRSEDECRTRQDHILFHTWSASRQPLPTPRSGPSGGPESPNCTRASDVPAQRTNLVLGQRETPGHVRAILVAVESPLLHPAMHGACIHRQGLPHAANRIRAIPPA
jgi:hypothetical protein